MEFSKNELIEKIEAVRKNLNASIDEKKDYENNLYYYCYANDIAANRIR